jgi:ATP-dependent DNA helicase RecQ
MLSLCETGQCRRKSLLAYFEEELEENCNNCDTCLEPGELWDAMVDAQKVLSVIFKTGQSFGAGHVIDVLLKSKNTKVLSRGHDKLSVYGIGSDRSKNHWNAVLRQLLNLNYVGIKNWEYRNLALTQKSSEILKGNVSFMMKKTKEGKIAALKSKKVVDVSHGRLDLFEDLRSIRREIAEENGVPPYVIFGDKSLHDMCQLMPRNKSEFLLVNGVGASKCDKYGQVFLSVISNFNS